MNEDIICRQNQLTTLQNYLKDVDTEVTMILQNLQWDRKHLAEANVMVSCQYDIGHRMPPDKLLEHEIKCSLKGQGYIDGDRLLPSPLDPEARTLIKQSGKNIAEIIKNASYCQPSFHTGAGCSGHQPLTLGRLQATYTSDERRAIHDAVVNQVPSCHDLSDLALLSSNDNVGKESKTKSKLEVLAELRDMRRRRTKYRVAAKSRNHSDVLRDVISTQMEMYTQAHISVRQIHNNMKDSDSVTNNKVNSSVSEEIRSTYTDNTQERNSQGIAGQRYTTSIEHMQKNETRHSRQHDDYETRKRRYNESDYIHNSKSGSKTDHHRDRSNSKPKRRDDEHYSSKARKEGHRQHDKNDSRKKYLEKEYDRTESGHHNEYTTKDKTMHSHYSDSKLKGNHNSNERNSNRLRTDRYSHGSTKSSSKSLGDDDRGKRYGDKRDRVHTAVKTEKDERYDVDSNRREDMKEGGAKEVTDITRNREKHHYGMKSVKIEKECHLKIDGKAARDDRVKDNEQSSNAFNEYQLSNIAYGAHSKLPRYRDINTYNDKYKDRKNCNDIQQSYQAEKIKEEKGIHEKSSGYSVNEQPPRSREDGRRYKSDSERCRNTNETHRTHDR